MHVDAKVRFLRSLSIVSDGITRDEVKRALKESGVTKDEIDTLQALCSAIIGKVYK